MIGSEGSNLKLSIGFGVALLIGLGTLSSSQGPGGRQPWVDPHPEIHYLTKPAAAPADWLVEHPPVNPDASPEAKALLHLLYGVSGKHTLTGQHNFPNEQEFNTNVYGIYSGKTPTVYGTDFGFAAPGDKDSAYSRHELVQTLIRKFRAGHVIALCWHEVPPTMDEPVTFRGQIQSKITDQQFDDLLTPGTAIQKHWLAQIDSIAEYLKELRDAHVPVLWRPFHEINGDWFWWNGRRGDATHGTKQLYRLMYDRFVNLHHLNNLLWVWNPDQPSRADRQFVDYFPGLDTIDVLGFDCYGEFKQSFYDDLNALSGGKVMGISETSNPPLPAVYEKQPKWSYYMCWSMDKRNAPNFLRPPTPVTSTAPVVPRRGMSREVFRSMVADPRLLSLQDPAWLPLFNPVLKAAGLRGLRQVAAVAKTPEGN